MPRFRQQGTKLTISFYSMHDITSVASMNNLASLLSRFYEKAEESNLPNILKDCMDLFRSEALFLLLSNFTGLKLHFLAPSEEDEVEDRKEGEGTSAADHTEEGTSHSSPGPESPHMAVSNSSQQSSGQTDPESEENEAKKGKLLV